MTTEKLHDALNLLPGDLIAATDKLRSAPRKKIVPWRRYVSLAACLVMVLTLGWLFHTGLPRATDKAKQQESMLGAAPQEAPAEAVGTWAAGDDAAMDVPMEEIRREYGELDTITLTPTGPASDAEEDKAANGSLGEGACTSEVPLTEVVLDLAPTQYAYTPMDPFSSVNISPAAQTILIRSRSELDAYYEEQKDLFDLDGFYACCQVYDEAWFEAHDLLMLRLGAGSSEAEYEVIGFHRAEETEGEVWYLNLTVRFGEKDRTPDTGCFWHILMEADKGLLTGDDVILIEKEE